MKSALISFTSGIIFSIGLTISGMINPDKVKGFLDIFGKWDYSLAFVMIGAIGLNFLTFRVVTRRKPLCSDKHFLPTNNSLDKKLIAGAVIFGIGWGLVGICPGPGLVNFITLNPKAILFVVSMTAGMGVFKILENKLG